MKVQEVPAVSVKEVPGQVPPLIANGVASVTLVTTTETELVFWKVAVRPALVVPTV